MLLGAGAAFTDVSLGRALPRYACDIDTNILCAPPRKRHVISRGLSPPGLALLPYTTMTSLLGFLVRVSAGLALREE